MKNHHNSIPTACAVCRYKVQTNNQLQLLAILKASGIGHSVVYLVLL